MQNFAENFSRKIGEVKDKAAALLHREKGSSSAEIPIRQVQSSVFEQLREKLIEEHAASLGTGEWIEVDRNTPVINYAAGPCLMVYAFSREKLLVGHFPNVNHDEADQTAVSRINTRTRQVLQREDETTADKIIPFDIEKYGLPGNFREAYPEDYVKYVEFLHRLAEITQSDAENTDVYLFGQSDYWYLANELKNPATPYERKLDKLTKHYKELFAIVKELFTLRIPLSHIHDNRTVGGESAVDSTIYLPKKGFLHLHQKNGAPQR